jgi:glycerol-3-phosphate O-acyltransferase / dihydroxyacetone phosphate acyltransferase
MKFYHILRPIATLAFKTYFKKIDYSGVERIPQGKPLIFSCNHPTGFFEPCLLACMTWEFDYHFITRGDMFANPLHRKLMESLNMVPIFRFRDGYANMKNNGSSMEFIYKTLAEKKSILIFSEGGTETKKQLRPIQKGLARMAFGNYDQYGDLDLHIIPVCFTYTDPHHARSEAMVAFGEPIPLKNYYAQYAQSPPKATTQLTADVEKAMKPLLVHIEKEELTDLLENLFTLYRNTYPLPMLPIFFNSKRRLWAHQEIVENVENMDAQNVEILRGLTDNYFKKLKDKDLNDFAVAQPNNATPTHLMALVLGFIPFVFGWLTHLLPKWYGLKVRNEKVKYLEFQGPVTAAVGYGVYLFQLLILFIIALIINKLSIIIFVLVLPFMSYFAFLYLDLRQKYVACKRLEAMKKQNMERSDIPNTFGTEGPLLLKNERENILKMVRENQKSKVS